MLIGAQVVGSPLFFNADYVQQTHQKLPERHLLKWIALKISKLPKITKSCKIYVILKLLLKKKLLAKVQLAFTEEGSFLLTPSLPPPPTVGAQNLIPPPNYNKYHSQSNRVLRCSYFCPAI